MKKNKEIIAEIVDGLKSTKDYPYKEGAWENFNQKESISSATGIRVYKYLAIAAMLLIGIFIAYYSFVNKETIYKNLEQHNDVIAKDLHKDVIVEGAPEEINEFAIPNPILGSSSFIAAKERKHNNLQELDFMNHDNNIHINAVVDLLPLNQLNVIAIQFKNPAIVVKEEFAKEQLSQDLVRHLVLANGVFANNVLSNSNLEKSLNPKSFKFSEKFDLGLYISPFTNSENLRVGAGLTLAYNINNKISIRTGASYNTYEVGLLKNPLAASSVEQVEVDVLNSSMQLLGKGDDVFFMSKLAIPNINAVSGFVQSVEIPLEVKYSLNKSLYAAAGVSYSTIVSQERNAQYVENINFNTFSDGFPANEQEASRALKVVTKTVKSADKNVNTSGYNGFINLSVGKKMKVNRKFGVAIEPYYKIPVGEFRKADMNYSNGGVRIMTNF